MGSISKVEQLSKWIEDAARESAYDLRLPWNLRELRQYGELGFAEARTESDSLSSRLIRRHIGEEVRSRGKSLRAQVEAEGGNRLAPSDERVWEALKAFPKPEKWKHLLEGYEYEEVRAFRGFLVANKVQLEQSLRPDRYKGICLRAWERELVLRLGGKVEVFDIWAPLQALRLWQENRALNRRGLSSFGKRRTTAEEASARGIVSKLALEAESVGLKLYGAKVKKWLNSFEKESFDDFKGDITLYVLKRCYPKAYERLRRPHETEE